ncbi:MAG: hypothetical protein ACE5KM_02555 [Planctomycetaceae bacterium]
MERVLPASFLFRYALPVLHRDPIQPGKSGPRPLPPECRLPDVAGLDAGTPFAELRLAWNDAGLAVSLEVTGKAHPPQGDPNAPAESDGLQLWIDTRKTQNIHRAGRFCHHFCILPQVAGRRKDRPRAIQLPIARAREDAPLVESKALPVNAQPRTDGYRLDAWLPAAVLNGYDPDSAPRLGFYYCVRDSELGDQTLSVGAEFPYAHDPSLWATLELVRDG